MWKDCLISTYREARCTYPGSHIDLWSQVTLYLWSVSSNDSSLRETFSLFCRTDCIFGGHSIQCNTKMHSLCWRLHIFHRIYLMHLDRSVFVVLLLKKNLLTFGIIYAGIQFCPRNLRFKWQWLKVSSGLQT